MGLEGVELVMMCEERFGVELSDEEVNRAFTPRLLTDLIASKLKTTDQKTCQSQRAFYILRRALMRNLNIKRGQLTPYSPLRTILPRGDITKLWHQLKTETQARSWPDLSRPLWMRRTIAIFAISLAVATMIFLQTANPINQFPVNFFSSAMVALIAAAFLIWITRNFKRYAPHRLKTVKDLVQFALTSDEVLWTNDAVAQQIKEIVIKEFRIPAARYGEDSHFYDDIGLSG